MLSFCNAQDSVLLQMLTVLSVETLWTPGGKVPATTGQSASNRTWTEVPKTQGKWNWLVVTGGDCKLYVASKKLPVDCGDLLRPYLTGMLYPVSFPLHPMVRLPVSCSINPTGSPSIKQQD